MPAIVIAEFMDETAVREGLAGHDVLHHPTLVDRPADLAAALADARALIVRNRTQVTAALLASAPKLEAVGRLGVGLDNIDLAACAARNITVYPATGANDISVAEYVMAAALMLLRGAYGSTADVISGTWPRNRLIGHEIAGKTFGLIGFGSIGRETARRAAAFDMKIVAHDPHLAPDHPAWIQPSGRVERLELVTLMERSDIVSLHVPLTPQTKNLVDRTAIARMKKSAVVINTARGGVIDEAAVVEALKAGHLGGAALDVFTKEPISGEAGKAFADCPNLLLTPHIAGVTEECNARVSRLIADKIRQHLAGIGS